MAEAKRCPDCNRVMRPKTSRTPEGAWYCEYCKATWTPVKSIAPEKEKPRG